MTNRPPHRILSTRIGAGQGLRGVFVSRYDLAAADQFVSDFPALLTAEELDRAKRLLRPEDQLRAAASRAILRAGLGWALDRDPADLVFETGPHGKPRLAGGGEHFSVSHSADRLVIAQSRFFDVGVDVEGLDLPRDVEAASRFALNEDERNALDAIPGRRRKRAFLRLWTTKEAVLKALGVGLRAPMRKVAIDPKGLESLADECVAWRPRSATVDGATIELHDVSINRDVIGLALLSQPGGANSLG